MEIEAVAVFWTNMFVNKRNKMPLDSPPLPVGMNHYTQDYDMGVMLDIGDPSLIQIYELHYQLPNQFRTTTGV
jgi:hypothetical protein